MATAGWAAGAAGCAASESVSDGAQSATFRALAWSQDDAPADEPVPYSGEDYSHGFDQGATGARPQVAFAHEDEDYAGEPEPLPWYKRPPILFGAAAAAALLAVGGLAVTLSGTSSDTGPVTETATTIETESVARAAGGTRHIANGDGDQARWPRDRHVRDSPPPPDDHNLADHDHHGSDHDHDDHHHHDGDHHHADHHHPADDDAAHHHAADDTTVPPTTTVEPPTDDHGRPPAARKVGRPHDMRQTGAGSA